MPSAVTIAGIVFPGAVLEGASINGRVEELAVRLGGDSSDPVDAFGLAQWRALADDPNRAVPIVVDGRLDLTTWAHVLSAEVEVDGPLEQGQALATLSARRVRGGPAATFEHVVGAVTLPNGLGVDDNDVHPSYGIPTGAVDPHGEPPDLWRANRATDEGEVYFYADPTGSDGLGWRHRPSWLLPPAVAAVGRARLEHNLAGSGGEDWREVVGLEHPFPLAPEARWWRIGNGTIRLSVPSDWASTSDPSFRLEYYFPGTVSLDPEWRRLADVSVWATPPSLAASRYPAEPSSLSIIRNGPGYVAVALGYPLGRTLILSIRRGDQFVRGLASTTNREDLGGVAWGLEVEDTPAGAPSASTLAGLGALHDSASPTSPALGWMIGTPLASTVSGAKLEVAGPLGSFPFWVGAFHPFPGPSDEDSVARQYLAGSYSDDAVVGR